MSLIENLDEIWGNDNKPIHSKLENYYYKEIPKNKLSNAFLMKETIKNLLVNDLKVSEDLIDINYRLKDKNNKIHRFELVVHLNNSYNLILRLIYAKSLKQADFWVKRIVFEDEILKEKEPNSIYLAVISGLAFKNIIKNSIDDKLKLNLVAFPSWEKIYEIESLKEKFKLLNIKIEKQISLDNF